MKKELILVRENNKWVNVKGFENKDAATLILQDAINSYQ